MKQCLSDLILCRAVVFLSFLFFGITSNCYSQNHRAYQVDSILGEFVGNHTPAVGVMILKNNEAKFSKSYGFSNIGEKIEATEKTNYHLASLTRQFTSMAVLMLMEAGKASPDAKIVDIWQDLPAYCNQITIGHLLRQNSGLPSLSVRQLYWEIKDIGDLKAYLKQYKQLQFEPGKRSVQNPVNDALLASYVEIVSGKDYRKFIDKRIFEPLGMEQSRVQQRGWFTKKISHKATGYMRKNQDVYQPVPGFPKDYYKGATGIFSSLNDMKKWLKAWDNETLISQSTLSQIKKMHFVMGQKHFPGYGWQRGFNQGRKYFFAGGIGQGSSHIVLRIPREKIDVIILSNQYPLFGLRKKAFELVNLFSEKQYEVK